jgi:hypothetical protein
MTDFRGGKQTNTPPKWAKPSCQTHYLGMPLKGVSKRRNAKRGWQSNKESSHKTLENRLFHVSLLPIRGGCFSEICGRKNCGKTVRELKTPLSS